MDWIEKKITAKYGDDKILEQCDALYRYWKVKRVFTFIPRVVVNTYLCARFPFLKFKKGFFQKSSRYWEIEPGWRKTFGIQLCKELKWALKRANMLHDYHITTVKDKFGALNIYDEGAPEEVHDIINKYEYISSRTCRECGRPAKYRTKLDDMPYWEEPYCEDCLKNFTNYPADEYYKDFDWYGWKK